MRSIKNAFCPILVSLSIAIGLDRCDLTPSTPSQPQRDSLKLPSFSIFGLPASPEMKDQRNLLDRDTLEKFLAEAAGRRPERAVGEDNHFWIIPMVLYQARGLFSKTSWNPEEIKQGQTIGEFFARLARRPDLRIDSSDQISFRQGLARLRDWFVVLCQDNKSLASMIFTMDDGPFVGEKIDVGRISEMRVVHSDAIPSRQDRFVLMTDGRAPEPMIIGVLNGGATPKWLSRLTAAPTAKLTDASLQRPAVFVLEGYGFMCVLTTDGTYGREKSHIYLDESLNLRFYYVSW